MSLHITMKCPLHPRYDPMVGGEAAIRGACTTCYGLLILYREYLRIRQLKENE